MRDALLALGGTAVVLLPGNLEPESLNQRILEQCAKESTGQSFTIRDANEIKSVDLQPCECHYNCVKLYYATGGSLKVFTGYALTEDGLWRHHSWCRHDVNPEEIWESTVERLMYVGVETSSPAEL